ncbi:MAG: hypothetical protein IJ011_03015 [Clostridia bacterium]|nr:hypothetical protein [Clostridia bacterium]
MDLSRDTELRALAARLDDLALRAAKGDVGITPFLSPRELHMAREYLSRNGAAFASFGGYADAERQRVYLLPEYMEEISSDEARDDFENKMSEYGYSLNISLLKISGSGYRQLTHRDFLGSVLGLGIERSVVGDIVVLDGGREAAVFCDGAISDFIAGELLFVANDKVKVTRVALGSLLLPEKRTLPIHDTVAAPRLDAVVAAICSLSRERARETVVSGLVELDFEAEERPDRAVNAPAVISVRGFGRYRVLSLCDKTRKGRYRLEAEKYI